MKDMSLESSLIHSGDEILSISFRKERSWKTPSWAEQKNAVFPFSKITKKLVLEARKTRKASCESKAECALQTEVEKWSKYVSENVIHSTSSVQISSKLPNGSKEFFQQVYKRMFANTMLHTVDSQTGISTKVMLSEGTTNMLATSHLELLCESNGKIYFERNIGSKLVLSSLLTKEKNSVQNTNCPSTANACAGFWLNTEHGFRAGNAAFPFLVEEYMASGSNADRGLLQLIANMIVAYVGMRREIGAKISVVYGGLQIGTDLMVYRLFSAVPTEKAVPKADAPYILQMVGKFDLRDPEGYLASLELYYALYQQAEICLFELLDSLIKHGRKSVEILKEAQGQPAAKPRKTKSANITNEVQIIDLKDCKIEDYFLLGEQLHETDYCLVWRAQMPLHPVHKNKNVVVKIHASKTATAREIDALTRLGGSHGIPQLIAVAKRNQRSYLVLPDLSPRRLNLGPQLLPAQVKSVMKQLFQGLAYLHSSNTIHGDIKPDNLLYNMDDELFIIDFGSTLTIGEKLDDENVAGTEGYIFPKLKKGEPADVFLDLYSSGKVLLFLVLGHNSDDMQQWNRLKDINLPMHDLFMKLVSLDKKNRLSAAQALHHQYFATPELAAYQ